MDALAHLSGGGSGAWYSTVACVGRGAWLLAPPPLLLPLARAPVLVRVRALALVPRWGEAQEAELRAARASASSVRTRAASGIGLRRAPRHRAQRRTAGDGSSFVVSSRRRLVVGARAPRRGRPVETAAPEDWDASCRVNIRGHAVATKAVLPHMKHAGGSIVFLGNISRTRASWRSPGAQRTPP